MAKPLILASSSKYRAQLLQRLGLAFTAIAPDLDESARPGEAPPALAQRLALAKARAIANQHPDAWVVGSDQVPSRDGTVLGKPGNRPTAAAQLRSFSGHPVIFHTAVALVRGAESLTHLDTTVVRFRHLSDDEIERYLDAEPAYDCAGSFKAEGLGISLFDAIESADPTGLIGLPMIALSRMLREAGQRIP